MRRRPPRSSLFPYTTLFRSLRVVGGGPELATRHIRVRSKGSAGWGIAGPMPDGGAGGRLRARPRRLGPRWVRREVGGMAVGWTRLRPRLGQWVSGAWCGRSVGAGGPGQRHRSDLRHLLLAPLTRTAVVPRRRGTARRTGYRGRPRHGLPVGAAPHAA